MKIVLLTRASNEIIYLHCVFKKKTVNKIKTLIRVAVGYSKTNMNREKKFSKLRHKVEFAKLRVVNGVCL